MLVNKDGLGIVHFYYYLALRLGRGKMGDASLLTSYCQRGKLRTDIRTDVADCHYGS